MIGRYVPPERTVVTPKIAIMEFTRGVEEMLGHDVSPACIAALASQSALESGNWRAMWNFNPSNIKHENSRDGTFTCIRLNEVIGGKVVWFDPDSPTVKDGPKTVVPNGHPQTRMRAYNCMADGVRDKLGFLKRPRWAAALAAAIRGDASSYVRECKKQNYFTAPLEPYERAVVSLARKYLPLAEGAEKELVFPRREEDQLVRDMRECFRFGNEVWALVVKTMHQSYEDNRASVIADRDALIREMK